MSAIDPKATLTIASGKNVVYPELTGHSYLFTIAMLFIGALRIDIKFMALVALVEA